MKATNLKVGDTIDTRNIYTGRYSTYKVIAVSKAATKITVERLDWMTKKMELTYRPSYDSYANEYSGEWFRNSNNAPVYTESTEYAQPRG